MLSPLVASPRETMAPMRARSRALLLRRVFVDDECADETLAANLFDRLLCRGHVRLADADAKDHRVRRLRERARGRILGDGSQREDGAIALAHLLADLP